MVIKVINKICSPRHCSNSYQAVNLKRLCWLTIKLASLLTLLLILIILAKPSVRDFVLYPIWPRVYRGVGTYKLYTMSQYRYPKGVTGLECPELTEPLVKRSQPANYRGMSYLTDSSVPIITAHLKDPSHAYFLPGMNRSEAEDLLHIYLVLAEHMRGAGVDFFMEGGSLLGAVRHKGFIPWDDDIDVAVSAKLWRETRQALSCIQGFKLRVKPHMHWEFHRYSRYRTFPYIDIFFYDEDDQHIWAIPPYVRKSTFVLPKTLVFPLRTVEFEGHLVPVPGRPREVVDYVFGSVCESPIAHHRDTSITRKGFIYPVKNLVIFISFSFE